MTEIIYGHLTGRALNAALGDLADILFSCVKNGASVSFIQPFCLEDAKQFWQNAVFPEVREGKTLLFFAKAHDRIVGTVQLQTDLPPNQAHRCEVAKLLVHPEFRKRGIATTLMEMLEEAASEMGKSLITLDTRSGDQAEPLYILLNYKIAGQIPNFARATDSERLDSTTYMYKILNPVPA
ncbi:GNAT family N-acetyltransferase [uncultured Cohaesibacter sp.]|uniref:GNAT family N-acetyltransferase n=1 Tax=uncultured Cohaesibacter sp. TaxID=1002546 RepID=UPI00292EE5AB|nr:GNAT family N-acetyltransferase [uncultured Cohaesibacter sp.]